MDIKELTKAEHVLAQLTDTFRAVQYLNDILASLKPVVGGIAQLEAQLEAKKAELAAMNDALGKARHAAAEAKIEKEKADAAVVAVKAQLQKLGL